MPVIRLSRLSHAYRPGVFALRDVELTVEQGERVALLGESGAGKSTLLRCLNGLVTPTTGTVTVLGQPVNLLGEDERRLLRRRIGMVFQEFNLIERMTVLQNVLVGRLGYVSAWKSCLRLFPSADVQLAQSCIEQVGLNGYAHTKVRNLSGGQKQRVGIARALAQQAEIILGDEPIANLDIRTSQEIMRLLRDINRRTGATIVLSLHDVDAARHFCTRIVGLRAGEVVFDGAVERCDEKVIQRIFY
ncbi:MAG: phosphonate ABC transporter ATP-binding protein [Abditibacteriales bacterium]|nr:phosphonate ABC transporter ATP-binding protein [Abditibacteriales bacterium]MDW8366500.1 phosphonate ABC transporter ATP-binding protein [Abditibacteriales bacterium]